MRAILPGVLATKDLMTAEPGVWVEGPDGELVPDYESTFPEINEGEVVHGTVVRVDKDEVLVDIGYKSEGVIPVAELSIRRSVNPADEVALGDEIDALVLTKEDAEGRLILSKKRARFELAWKNIERAAESGDPVDGRVIEVVKGGLILDLGVRGFLPASLVDIRRVQDLDEFLGQELRCKVIELNRSRNNVVLSRRAVLEEERKEQRQQILDKLQPGAVVEGQISNIVDFGAFVDLDGMDGLIHISELSWSHVNHPAEVLEIGQTVQVKVLDIDRDRQRISLGLKQTQNDPWQQVLDKYKEGDVVEGRVTKVVTFGAFVEILPGVEGLVHISELAAHHVENPREVVAQGQAVNVKIIEVDGERRRLSLSIKRIEEDDQVQPRADGGESVHLTPQLDITEDSSDEPIAEAPDALAELAVEPPPAPDRARPRVVRARRSRTGVRDRAHSSPPAEEETAALVRAAELPRRLIGLLLDRLEERELTSLYRSVELPLTGVLADMERAGVKIDTYRMGEITARLAERVAELEARAYELAGEEFMLGSTQQVARILFEKLELTSGRKGKTGYSTDARVLRSIRGDHDLVPVIEEWRELSKLLNTYLGPLPTLIDESTGRLHTTINQTVASTGRLSTTSPNLQSIPIRTDLGKEIRSAFIAEEGAKLLSADYSQIELRILAHVSGEPKLREAFERGEDIHRTTAAEVLGKDPATLTTGERSIAKMINFGIVYGISAFGLSENLEIPRDEAQAYIDAYLARFPHVQDFIARTIEQAKRDGYVTSLLGRRRPVPEIRAGNRQTRSLGERLAVNFVMQGSNADIIKVAMIRIQRRLRDEGRAARMVLQVHDELLLEVPDNEVTAIKELVRAEMCGAYELDPPLAVDVGVGENWAEAKS